MSTKSTCRLETSRWQTVFLLLNVGLDFRGSFAVYFSFCYVVHGWYYCIAYLGFAKGLFGLHSLRFLIFIYGYFGASLCVRLSYILPIYGWFGACLTLFSCLFSFGLGF